MTEKERLIEKEFKDIDQALRRAAQAAKKLAEQNGTPLVVAEAETETEKNDKLHNHEVAP